MTRNKLRVGAHVSSAGGYDRAVERASQIGANCLQLFSGSPRGWQRPDLKTIDANKISSKQRELDVKPIIIHALYLINLVSDQPLIKTKSLRALKETLLISARMKAGGVVVHLGSHQGRGWLAVRDQLLVDLTALLTTTPKEARLLIENSAGQKGKINSDLVEIQWLLTHLELKANLVSQNRVGWCFDTCHAWAAGYFFSEKAPKLTDAAKNPIRGQAMDEIKRLNLLASLACVHVNGSRDPFASGKDRHANLGEGLLPLEDISRFINLPAIRKLPLILETPGLKKPSSAKKEVEKLRQILGEKGTG